MNSSKKDGLNEEDTSVVMGSNFGALSDCFFRLSVRDEKTNQLFI